MAAAKVRQLQAARGGDREIGRKLPRILSWAGFRDIRVSAVALSSANKGLAPFLPQFRPERYRRFVDALGLWPAELEEYRQGYGEFLSNPDAFILQVVLVISGVKPNA